MTGPDNATLRTAITKARGVLAHVGALLGHEGSSTARTVYARRAIEAAGLLPHLAAVQATHGTGRAGNRTTRRATATVRLEGKVLDVLLHDVRAASVHAGADGPAWASATVELDERGRITGRLKK